MARFCSIENASIELPDGGGDGAYDLLDVAGTPEEVGAKIAESLKESFLMSGDKCYPDDGEIFITLRIKITK